MIKAHGADPPHPLGQGDAPKVLTSIKGGTANLLHPIRQNHRCNRCVLKSGFPDDRHPIRHLRLGAAALKAIQGTADDHAAIRLLLKPKGIPQSVCTDNHVALLRKGNLL